MRQALILMLVLPLLAACGETETAAPQASAPAAAGPASPASVAVAAPTDLEGACRDVVNRMFGQQGEAVTYTATDEASAEVSWRAPVDGGVLSFECRAEGDRVGLFRDGRSMSVDVQPAVPAKEEAR